MSDENEENERQGYEVGPFVRFFPTGSAYTSDIPLPVMERQGGSPEAGHMINEMDWAILLEMLTDKCSSLLASDTDVWPFTASSVVLGDSLDAHAGMVELLMETVVSNYLDPDWEPTAGPGNWMHWESGYRDYLLQRTSPELRSNRYNNGRFRGVDDIRRVYYDIKRMTRRSMNFRAFYKRGTVEDANYFPSVVWSDHSTPQRSDPSSARVEVAMAEIPDKVKQHQNFRATPAFAMVDIYCRSYRDYSILDETLTFHLPVEIGANGNIPLEGWTTADILAKMREKWGQGRDGYTYQGYASLVAVYYDVYDPLYGILAPWRWEPEENTSTNDA